MRSLLEANGLALANRLHETDLAIAHPQMVAVIGPNGAGKTSLLRALAGIELDRGAVRITGENVSVATPSRRMRLLSFLPATRGLIWPISARDVIELGLPSPNSDRVDALVERLELRDIVDRAVNQLSTGERSRVLLARALVARPKLLLLDEPLSNLDPYWVLCSLKILREESKESLVLASLHDLGQVAVFDRVMLVDGGRIIADGLPEDVMRSAQLSDAFRIERSGDAWKIAENA